MLPYKMFALALCVWLSTIVGAAAAGEENLEHPPQMVSDALHDEHLNSQIHQLIRRKAYTEAEFLLKGEREAGSKSPLIAWNLGLIYQLTGMERLAEQEFRRINPAYYTSQKEFYRDLARADVNVASLTQTDADVPRQHGAARRREKQASEPVIDTRQLMPKSSEMKTLSVQEQVPAIVAREAADATASQCAIEPALEFINRWAEAWQGKRITDYLGMYSPQFLGGHGSHQAWLRSRQNSIRSAGRISLVLSGITISASSADPSGCAFNASFVQHYGSEVHADEGIKTLLFRHSGGRFEILEERFTKNGKS